MITHSVRKAVPTGAVLHKASVEAEDVQEWAGFRVTSPQRTLLDVATDQSITEEQLDGGTRTRAALLVARSTAAPAERGS